MTIENLRSILVKSYNVLRDRINRLVEDSDDALSSNYYFWLTTRFDTIKTILYLIDDQEGIDKC